MKLIAPSVLSADFAHLAHDLNAALNAGATRLHIDVMDGRFVPNISFGFPIMAAIRPIAAQYGAACDVHLMIVEPEKYIGRFAQAGADIISVHVEATPHLHRAIQQIHEAGAKAGVAINPHTPLVMLEEVLPIVDQIIVMSVNPGFGGQSFIPSIYDKLRRLRAVLKTVGNDPFVVVDGGVKRDNAADILAAGGNVLIAGSAIFDGQKIAENVRAFQAIIDDD
jgi:ribulose-phosphate 3-epimerase